MDSHVTWNELIQFATFMMTYTMFLYTVFHNKKK